MESGTFEKGCRELAEGVAKDVWCIGMPRVTRPAQAGLEARSLAMATAQSNLTIE